MRETSRDGTAKWAIIIGFIVGVFVVVGLFTDWYGLHGVEQAPDPGPDKAAGAAP